jgi:NADH-quinone oxidoreductase subunit L
MAYLIWPVLFLPLIGVIINGLLLSGQSAAIRRRLSGHIATGAVALAFVCAALIAASLGSILNGKPWLDVIAYDWIDIPGSFSVPFAVRIDPLSVTMMLVVTGVGSLIHLFSIGYMADDERYGRYFTYLNLFTFAMLILVLANNYVLMFVGWEGVGLCSYLLIGFWFERVSAAQAGKKAFLVNRVGDFGFILGLFALFWMTGPAAPSTLSPGSLVFNTPEHTGALDRAGVLEGMHLWGLPAATAICLLLFLGATGKSAQIPLYVWLPDAMEGPTPVSALIHAATMVTAGVYMVARSAPLFELSPVAQSVVAWIGIITALWAAIIAMKQYDIKRVLAYSTVSQLGYMFAGVGVGAYAAGISHLVTHAFFKALMFLGAGAVMHALEGQLDMRKMGNLKAYLPVTFWTFTVGWLAISGFPGLSGFFSKDFIIDAAIEKGGSFVWIGYLGLFVAFLTAFYMSRMYFTVFTGSERIELGDEGHGGDAQEHGKSHAKPHGHAHDHSHDHGHSHAGHGHRHAHVHPESPLMNFPLIVLAVLSIIGGAVVFLLPQFLAPVTTVMAEAAKTAVDGAAHAAGGAAHGGEHGVHGFQFGIYSVIAVLAGFGGIGLAYSMRAAFERGWDAGTERLLGLPQRVYEGALHSSFVRGGTALSEGLYGFVDRLMIDNLVNGVAKVVDYLADSLRTLQTGYVRNYALVMLAGAVFVVVCFMVILQNQVPAPR